MAFGDRPDKNRREWIAPDQAGECGGDEIDVGRAVTRGARDWVAGRRALGRLGTGHLVHGVADR